MGHPSPLKVLASHWDVECGPPSNAWFFGPERVLNSNGISIGERMLKIGQHLAKLIYVQISEDLGLRVGGSADRTRAVSP